VCGYNRARLHPMATEKGFSLYTLTPTPMEKPAWIFTFLLKKKKDTGDLLKGFI
jgi:hypothetical protein